jgi:beta-lactamase class C
MVFGLAQAGIHVVATAARERGEIEAVAERERSFMMARHAVAVMLKAGWGTRPMRPTLFCAVTTLLCVLILLPVKSYSVDVPPTGIGDGVAQVIRPLMERYGIPGMAVGIVMNGKDCVFNYGVESIATGAPIGHDTLFEIGSISKTFTATLASYAQVSGKLALSDMASKYLPSLRGSSFDKVSLLNLGTHTSGGLPLQVPDEITNNAQLMAYFQSWKPTYTPGTFRTYSNPSIGMLGMIAAKSMHKDFVELMERRLLPALGMGSTFLNVPSARTKHYAQGYTADDVPVRMTPGVLGLEAYGIRTTASDMLRFVKANIHMLDVDPKWQDAITATHTGYYRIGAMTQDLIWEQYHYPIELDQLLAGNSAKIILEANPASELDPPARPRGDVLINKTGSTNGFAAYVAFVVDKRIGIILLANKSYPIDARVTAAFDILARLDDGPGKN